MKGEQGCCFPKHQSSVVQSSHPWLPSFPRFSSDCLACHLGTLPSSPGWGPSPPPLEQLTLPHQMFTLPLGLRSLNTAFAT